MSGTQSNRLSPLSWLILLAIAGYWVFTLAQPTGPPPIAGEGLRVLIVEDVTKRIGLTADQQEIIRSRAPGSVLDYLDSHCAKGPDGRTPEWRIINDQDPKNLENESQAWRDAFTRPRQKLPWIVASNGRAGFEGPLDDKPADLLSRLKKLGGE